MDKKYNQEQYEKEAQIKWQNEHTYSMQNNPGKLYSIDTPPPTVSGTLHIGHIFSYTQTDIIARYKRMSGFSVFYPFGFDDNGLPTERYVEKKRKISARQVGRSEFIKLCLRETQEVEKQFEDLWKKIGLSVDWSSCYSTISDSSRKISQESFIRLFEKGYVYRKNEPALYCTTCFTSVAQAELDDLEVASFFNNIQFLSDKGEQLVIGTTRPELLASCVALLYNPEDARYKHLKSSRAIVPIFGVEVPILQDALVKQDKGTGLVMVCTFGDKTDIEWYKKFKFPYKQSIGSNGKFLSIAGPLEGLNVHDARKKILELLKEQNLLLEQKPITHSVNVHERCKKEIEYVELAQWFINILDYKKEFLKIADEINWYPYFMKSRYINWVENISWDWCISRQRFFGIPFPVWHCKDCGNVLVADIKDLPIDPQEIDFKNQACTKCSSKNIVPDTDVMDTWNTSSLTPQICYSLFNPKAQSVFTDLEANEFIPMSMRPQAHDIIRTWAFDTIVKSWMHFKKAPWKDIIISGHVLSSAHEKISKSKGNESITPENLLSRYPADAIRFWTASGSLGQDTSFSEEQIKIGQRLMVKLWNAFRFSFEHLQGFTAIVEPKNFGLVNEWILNQANETFQKYQDYFQKDEIGLALDTIEAFFWKDFCDNYLELIKDQLFKPELYLTEQVQATKWTLHNVGMRILQLYAPYLPYVTEAVYSSVYKNNLSKSSLHQTRFVDEHKAFNFDKSAKIMSQINNLVSQVRKLKSENQLSLKVELKFLQIYCSDNELIDSLKKQEQLIKGVTQAQIIEYNKNSLSAPKLENIDQAWIAKISV